LELTTFLKTTGGKGLHIVVPIQARTDWDDAKAFCKAVADLMVRVAPERYIATMSKAARKGKIFVDYLRNGRGATAIAPYSTRARPGAPVSVPIAWEELSARLHSDSFTIANLFARLSKLKKDPWAEIASTRQSITKTMVKRLKG
jgi:bifunctional non-homologous end joining protein LigD